MYDDSTKLLIATVYRYSHKRVITDYQLHNFVMEFAIEKTSIDKIMATSEAAKKIDEITPAKWLSVIKKHSVRKIVKQDKQIKFW